MLLTIDIREPRELVQAYAEELKLTLPMLLDQSATVAQAYGARSIPLSLFIDREGIVRARHVGPMNERLLEEYLDTIL